MRLLFLMLSFLLLTNCTGSEEKKQYEKNVEILTGKKWKYDNDAIREAAKHTLKTNQEQDLMNRALAGLENSFFAFNEDGSLLLERPERQHHGTWQLSKDSKDFYLLLNGGSSQVDSVVEISPNRIVFAADHKKGFLFPKIFVPFEE